MCCVNLLTAWGPAVATSLAFGPRIGGSRIVWHLRLWVSRIVWYLRLPPPAYLRLPPSAHRIPHISQRIRLAVSGYPQQPKKDTTPQDPIILAKAGIQAIVAVQADDALAW